MANTRVSDLAAGGAFSATDLFYVVETTGVGGVKKTGTQLVEFIQDTMNATLVGGSNISVTYNDPANTITIAYTGAPPPASTTDLPEGTNLYFTDERAQDAVGLMVTDGSLVYVDATPLLTRGALTGDVTAAQGSNVTTIANDAVTNAKLANMATATIKGRTTAGTGDPEDLTAAQARTVMSVRERLTADRTYFVSAAGSDSNNGLTSGTAFLTITFAMTTIAAIDNGGFTVTVRVVGNINSNRVILQSSVGPGLHVLRGDTATASAQVITNNSNTGSALGSISGTAQSGGTWTIQDLTIKAAVGGVTTSALAVNNSAVTVSNVAFDSSALYVSFILVGIGGFLSLNSHAFIGNITAGWQTQANGVINFAGGQVCTITGVVTYGDFWLGTSAGVVVARGTFAGSTPTGRRFTYRSGAVASVTAGSLTYFPGSVAGVGTNGVDGFYAF